MKLPAGRVSVLGIRHHGPGSARSVAAELDRLKPEIVLIEGPADATPLIPLAADPAMTPPVALLAYSPDQPRRSAFWPFAVFSPEWQGLTWSAAHGSQARFCDLPSSNVLAADDEVPDPENASSAIAPIDPIATLAELAGYDDAERWWDDVIESRLDGTSPFDLLTEAMSQLRGAGAASPEPRVSVREARREAHMRQAIRTALKETDGHIAVVCGAWHAPALSGDFPPASADVAELRGMPKVMTAITWVPWTHSRLAAASGYGAGVDSPGWYHHLFTATDRPVTRWLTRVAGVLRERDLPVSSAHVIEAVRLAETLASLRGRPLAGLAEVSEATTAVLCEGDPAAAAYVTSELVVGELMGAVPEGAPGVPLEADLRAQARTLRLTISPLRRELDLDLRNQTDRGRSVLLHRLAILGVGWGEQTAGMVRSTGTFRETWGLRWRPELAVAIVDAGLWGTTVVAAASARIIDLATNATDLAAVTGAVERALLADLTAALPEVIAVLDARAALDADVADLMASLPPLVRAARYGDVRGTDAAALAEVTRALIARISAGLPAAAGGLAADAAAALRQRLDAAHAAVTLFARPDNAHPAAADDGESAVLDLWLGVLASLAGRRDVHGLLAGRINRLLLDAGALDRAEAGRRFAAQLSVGVPAPDKAAWAEGFLSGSGLLLVHDPALLAVLDDWITALPGQDFLDVLPLLRRAFGAFTAPERANIATAVRALGTAHRGTNVNPDDDLDPALATPVLRTVAKILAGRR